MTMAAPELQALCLQWQKAPSPALREEIVRACLPLCRRIAARFAGRGAEREDLEQVAALACLRALDAYAPEKGIPFEAWAAQYAAGAARNHLRDHAGAVRVPRGLYEQTARLTQARARLTLEGGREPTVSQLSAALGWDRQQTLEVLMHLQAREPLSLDAEESSALLPFAEQGFAALEGRHDVRQALSLLAEGDRRLISLRYLEGLSQREAARQLEMTQMQVHRAEKRILLFLRERLETA